MSRYRTKEMSIRCDGCKQTVLVAAEFDGLSWCIPIPSTWLEFEITHRTTDNQKTRVIRFACKNCVRSLPEFLRIDATSLTTTNRTMTNIEGGPYR